MTPVCTVDGCTKRLKARGLCNLHYTRLQRSGMIETAPLALTAEERDLGAVAYHTGRIDARRGQPRRLDLADRSLIGVQYHLGYDAQRRT